MALRFGHQSERQLKIVKGGTIAGRISCHKRRAVGFGNIDEISLEKGGTLRVNWTQNGWGDRKATIS